MRYLEIKPMEENTIESKFQQLSQQQKETFIRKKLAEFRGDVSETAWKELNARLLHPEFLVRESTNQPRLLPQHGKIIGVTPDITAGRRNRRKFIIVDLTGTVPINNLPYAQFSLASVEISKKEEIFIDCSKLETLKGGGTQAMFPQNTFVDRISVTPTLIHK